MKKNSHETIRENEDLLAIYKDIHRILPTCKKCGRYKSNRYCPVVGDFINSMPDDDIRRICKERNGGYANVGD